MERQRRVIVWAAQRVTAITADHAARRAAPVQKQDRLLAAFQGARQGEHQGAGEHAHVAAAQLRAHVDHFDIGQRLIRHGLGFPAAERT